MEVSIIDRFLELLEMYHDRVRVLAFYPEEAAELKRALHQAKKDGARLDFIQSLNWTNEGWSVVSERGIVISPRYDDSITDIRQAVDAAILADTKQEG